jgi:hypothetical protein
MLGSSRVAAQLAASREGLSSMSERLANMYNLFLRAFHATQPEIIFRCDFARIFGLRVNLLLTEIYFIIQTTTLLRNYCQTANHVFENLERLRTSLVMALNSDSNRD